MHENNTVQRLALRIIIFFEYLTFLVKTVCAQYGFGPMRVGFMPLLWMRVEARYSKEILTIYGKGWRYPLLSVVSILTSPLR